MSSESDFENDDDVRDEWEDALSECGQSPNYGCTLAGTEYCDFECPFRDGLYGDEDEEGAPR